MHRHESEASSGGCLIAFGLVFGGIPGAMGLVALSEGEWIPFLFTGIFVLIGLAMIAGGVHQMMGDRLFQELYLETPRPFTKLGETMRWKLGMVAKSSFRIDTLVVKYYLEEKAIFRRGTDSTTYSKRLFEQEVRFEPKRDLRAGESFVQEGTFQCPADGPSTFEAPDNSLIYKVEISMDVPSWPDPSKTWTVPMRPILSAEAGAEGGEGEGGGEGWDWEGEAAG